MRPMRRGPRLVIALVAVFALVGLVGCSTETKIDPDKAAALVKDNIHGNSVPVDSVDCPDDVTAKEGGTFDCTVNFADGKQATTTIKMTDNDGTIETVGGLKLVK
jgi:Domain of unknown function (DUF4333)